jgi:hypothetical protein
MAKPAIKFVLPVAAVIALAFVLNPSPEKHREKIKEEIASRSPIARMLGVGSLTAFASNYHSLVIASYTTVGDKTVAFGVFGMVFVLE